MNEYFYIQEKDYSCYLQKCELYQQTLSANVNANFDRITYWNFRNGLCLFLFNSFWTENSEAKFGYNFDFKRVQRNSCIMTELDQKIDKRIIKE